MTLSYKTLKDAPVVIVTVETPVDPVNDPKDATKWVSKFQKERGGKVWRITDYSNVKLTLGQVVEGMPNDTGFRDPNVVNYIVGTDYMTKTIAEGYKQKQYGGVEVKIFDTLEKAIATARKAATGR